jgi:hypothetical protein
MNARVPAMDARDGIPTPWATVLRWAAVLTILCAGAIHASVVEEHYREWAVEGLFFVALALVEALLAVAIATGPRMGTYRAAIALSLAAVALWTVSRTLGVPVGPEPWVPEPVGRADAVATLLELTTAAALAPLVLPVPGPAATGVAVALVGLAGLAVTAFALAPGAGHDAGDHVRDADVAVSVPPPRPSGEFSPADARRARRCARRGIAVRRSSTIPRTRVTITARRLCFDATTLTLAANRRVVVRLENRERRRRASRAHAFSIYAFSPIPAEHHPVVLGEPVAPGASLDVRFRAPAPGSYFFQCDVHRFMRGIVVFR